MDIVVLDGGTTNPGDLSWAPLEALGRVTVYDSTPADCVVRSRAGRGSAHRQPASMLNRAVLDALPKLRYIGTLATGYNTIDVRAAREKGVTVCNVPLYCVETVAQLTLALLLALCCRVEQLSAVTRSGGWNDAVEATHTTAPILELSGKTLGILGFGNIGRAVAQLGLALGMRVLVHSRTQRTLPAGCTWCGFETLFETADVVSLHCPLTDETRGIVSASVLARMKPTALLINTARGALVDENAPCGCAQQRPSGRRRARRDGRGAAAPGPPAAHRQKLPDHAAHRMGFPRSPPAADRRRRRQSARVSCRAAGQRRFLTGRPCGFPPFDFFPQKRAKGEKNSRLLLSFGEEVVLKSRGKSLPQSS